MCWFRACLTKCYVLFKAAVVLLLDVPLGDNILHYTCISHLTQSSRFTVVACGSLGCIVLDNQNAAYGFFCSFTCLLQLPFVSEFAETCRL